MKKATLLIRNLSKIYTCSCDEQILENGFIAMHHETIIALGQGDGAEYIEKNLTLVLDGQGEIAVPAFLDPSFPLENDGTFASVRHGREELQWMKQQGILNIAAKGRGWQMNTLEQELYLRTPESKYTIYSTFDPISRIDENTLISAKGLDPDSQICSLQPIMARLHFQYGIPAHTILQMATSRAAKAMKISKKGSLEVGREGDILILNVLDFQDYIKGLGKPLIHRMIKKGIPIYPILLRC